MPDDGMDMPLSDQQFMSEQDMPEQMPMQGMPEEMPMQEMPQ
jgi:hypothetical protein